MRKQLLRSLGGLVAAMFLLAIPSAQAQQFVLTNTTLSGAVTATQQTVTLASASASTGSTVGTPQVGWGLFVDQEFMIITSVPTSGATFGVRRGTAGFAAGTHATSTAVLLGPAGDFFDRLPFNKTCTLSTVPRPWVNVQTGDVGICLSGTWSFSNSRAVTYNSINVY